MSVETKLTQILADLAYLKQAQHDQADAIAELQKDCDDILILLGTEEPTLAGITLIPGPVTTHSAKGRSPMASVKMFKKGQLKRGQRAAPPTSGDIGLVDNGDQTFTVAGVDQAGNPAELDPSKVTLTATSDTPATVTADVPGTPPLTFAVHVPSPAPAVNATAKVNVTVTFTDGSAGPFTFTLNVTINPSAPGGITVTPGPVTTH